MTAINLRPLTTLPALSFLLSEDVFLCNQFKRFSFFLFSPFSFSIPRQSLLGIHIPSGIIESYSIPFRPLHEKGAIYNVCSMSLCCGSCFILLLFLYKTFLSFMDILNCTFILFDLTHRPGENQNKLNPAKGINYNYTRNLAFPL